MKATICKTLDPFKNRLRPLLEMQGRGSYLLDEEVSRVTGLRIGGEHWAGIQGFIREWYRRRAVDVQHRPEPICGFVILSDTEQSLLIPKRLRKAFKESKAAVRTAEGVDPLALDEPQRRTHEFMMGLAHDQLRASLGTMAQVRYTMTGKRSAAQLAA
jgi:hypothetical protein